MVGRLRSGRISMRVRINATTETSPSAITSTSTVTGLRSAARIRPMRPRSSSPDSWLALQQLKERREVTLRLCHTRQAAPDVQPRDGIVSLRLGQGCFGRRDLNDCCQARLITRLLLLFAFTRGC